MPTEEETRWAQMAGGGGNTATMPAAPPPEPQPGPPPAEASDGKKKRGKKEKAPKAPKIKGEKAPKAPKAEKPRRSSGGGRSVLDTESDWVLSLDDSGPSRQELEQMAAAELFAALAPSYDLLHAEVPDASSPEDAQRRIESQLGPAPQDMDAAIPDHPIWKGDALVYSQLKRHYGKPHQGSSFARGWFPGGQR